MGSGIRPYFICAYVFDPVAPGRAAPIDPADIAAVAAVTMTDGGHEGEEYLLTGARRLPWKSRSRSRPRRSVAISRSARWVGGRGSPVPLLPRRAAGSRRRAHRGLTLMRADTVGVRSDTIRRLLGREPLTFAD